MITACSNFLKRSVFFFFISSPAKLEEYYPFAKPNYRNFAIDGNPEKVLEFFDNLVLAELTRTPW